MASFAEQVRSLRDALYYTALESDRTVGQYRPKNSDGSWKTLTQDPKQVNLAKYEYRTHTRPVWRVGRYLYCANGQLPVTIARRILERIRTERSFALGGFSIIRGRNGLTIGCTTFSKEEVAEARELLAQA